VSQRFYLGTHQPGWLGTAGIPLFVSRRRLAARKSFPRALAPWALDSGGFTELDMFGGWTLPAADYVREVRRFRDEVGQMEWAAPQDWMCEPHIIQKTGLSIDEHQRRTVANYLELQDLAPDLPWIPVVQGWQLWSYWRCVEMYQEAGVDLAALPLVGIGTVCRRQGTSNAALLIQSLATTYRLKLHAFGFKKQGLKACANYLVSADSMAWSAAARREPPLPGHAPRLVLPPSPLGDLSLLVRGFRGAPAGPRPQGHKNCANCLEYALLWRNELPDEWLN
jgi:hypothetical protein